MSRTAPRRTPAAVRRRPVRQSLVAAGVLALAATGTLVATAPGAQAAATAVNSGSLDWGVRTSWRTYVVGAISQGTITPSAGATQNSGNGTFVFSGGTGTVDPTANTAALAYAGTVRFLGHAGALDTTVSSPSLTVNGTAVTLKANVVSKSLSTGVNTDYGNIDFATFSITSGSLTPNASGLVTATTGPGTFTAQATEALGGFYTAPDNNFTDPLTFTAQTATVVPSVPTVTVSKTTVSPSGETVTVSGTGFDPALATGTRPPLSGKPAGVYVAFGKFADVWKPSAGAASSTRVTGPNGTSVKWAVLEADRATVGQTASVTLNPNGSFTAEIQVSPTASASFATATGNFGIYTYAGSGAVQASYETYTPITFQVPTLASATQTITTTFADTGGLTMSVDNTQVTLPTPQLSADGTKMETTGNLNPVRVTDLRAANPGWSVSGQLSNFSTAGGGTLDGKYLGWTPSVTSSATGQTVVAGAVVAAGTGLKTSAPLASAAAGVGRGTAVVGAALALSAPSETVPGTYSATLTLTAI